MYTSLSIQNFRGIHALEMNDFRRVNILTGKNNCGKTSVLEALYFLSQSANPAIGTIFRIYRNINTLSEDYWRSFFYSFKTQANISSHYQAKRRELVLKFYNDWINLANVISIALKNSGDTSPTHLSLMQPDMYGVTIEYIDQENILEFAIIKADEQKEFEIEKMKSTDNFPSVPSTLFISPAYLSDAAKRFSTLELRKGEGGITDAIKTIEPSINYIKLINNTFYCDIGKARLLPLNVMGDGMVRMFSIILAIATTPGGVVLIDEIDTGFHYSTLEVMWKAVYAAAKQFDVQIFATTHSYECLRALSENLQNQNEDDTCLYRLDKREQEHKAVRFDQQQFVTSLEHFWEVR